MQQAIRTNDVFEAIEARRGKDYAHKVALVAGILVSLSAVVDAAAKDHKTDLLLQMAVSTLNSSLVAFMSTQPQNATAVCGPFERGVRPHAEMLEWERET